MSKGTYNYLFVMSGTVTSTLTLESIVIDGAKATYYGNTDTDHTSKSLILVYNPNTLNLNTGTVLQNNSAYANAAVSLSNNSNVIGAITFSMNGATVKDNDNTGSNEGGGGIRITAAAYEGVMNPIVINDSTISGNTAASGGGIYITDADLTIKGKSKISNNSATKGFGGGIYMTSAAGVDTTQGATARTIIIADETEFSGNLCGTVSGYTASNRGGAFALLRKTGDTNKINISITDTVKIQNNTSGIAAGFYTMGADVIVSTTTPVSGNIDKCTTSSSFVALYVLQGDLTLKNGVCVTGNTGGSKGTEFAVGIDTGKLTMESGSSIKNNGSQTSPCGGVKITTGYFDMKAGSEISGHYSNGGGAGVYLSATSGKIAGKITNNTAADSGGGIYYHSGTVSAAVSTNVSPALYIVDGAEITNNTAVYAGGGIYVNGSKFPDSTDLRCILYMQGGTVSGNKANGTDATGKDSGGGIAVARGQAVISGGTITNNTAALGAGGIQIAKQLSTYTGSGIVTLQGGTINNNTGSPANLGIQSVLYGELIIDSTFENEQDMIIDSTSSLTINANKSIKSNGFITLPVSTYMVTINPCGGSFELNSTSVSGASITLAAAVKAGYTFNGWNDGTIVHLADTAISISADTVLTADCTLNGGVGGRITDGTDGIGKATVKLQQGSTTAATVIADAYGYYLFANVPTGSYNLVVEKDSLTKTVLLDVTSAVLTQDVVLESTSKQSIVEVKDGTPNVVADGVDTIAEASTETEVIVKLEVEKVDDTQTVAQIAIADASDTGNLIFLDLSLTKQVGQQTAVDIGSTNSTVLKIIIPFSFKNKSNVKVYRYHDEAAAALTKLSKKPAAPVDGTYYLDTTNGCIILYASKYSTYAIGYSDAVPNTGDDSIVLLCGILAGLTAFGAGQIVYKKRKRLA